MKLCVAQTRPTTGDIERNIKNHKALTDLAVDHGANMIVFPELSLTGYEPTLAKALATPSEDKRLDIFQNISDAHEITIGVGAPTKPNRGICISTILFQPHQKRQIHSKCHLHADEEPFFVPGPNLANFKIDQTNIALAICYEISVRKHEEKTFKSDRDVYIASVAKFQSNIGNALNRLHEIAKRHTVPILMSNCIGLSDGAKCAGKTSVWNNAGELIGQLDDEKEGILIFDTEAQTVTKVVI